MQQLVSVSADSQKGIILKHFAQNKGRWFHVFEFCKIELDHFVGYKADSGICFLQKLGILVGRPSEFKSKFGGRFHEYTLADKIRIEEREEMINTGEHKTPKAKLYYDVYRSRNMFDRIFKKNK